MSSQVTMEATFGESKTLDVLADLISKRVRAIRRETTENAVIATSITVLTSIRARTKIANPKDTGGVIVAERGDLVPGFSSRERGKVVVCIRGSRTRIVDKSHPFHCIPSRISEASRVFIVRDVVSNSLKVHSDYFVIANSIDEAKTYAQERHVRRVERHAGMAKWALGLAQSQVSNRMPALNQTSDKAKQIATSNVHVTKQGDGYSSGKFNVTVSDALRYALLAMYGGEADLETALQKAANSTAAKIRKLADLGFDEECPTPFPEISGK